MINKFDDYSYSAIRDIVVDKLSTTNWIRTIDALRPNDSLTVDISSPEWIDLYLSRMDQFKEIIKESVFILKNQKLGGLRAESIFKNMKVLLISENEIEMDEIKAEKEGQTERIAGSHLLVAAGRTPNLNGLNLKVARVVCKRNGIEVDARLRTTNKKIFAKL